MSGIRFYFFFTCLALSLMSAVTGRATQLDDSIQLSRSLSSISEMEVAQEALRLCDSIHAAMDDAFKHKYSREVVPVRMEYNLSEMKLEADRGYHKLLYRIGIVTFSFCLVGVALFYIIRKANKNLARSEVDMMNAKHRAELAEKGKSMFLSNMTHEIRSPLNAIAGFSEVLTYPNLEDEVRKEAVEIIEMNSDLLHNLIEDVVNTACMDLREMNFRMAPCDVVKLSRNVTEMISKIKKTPADLIFESNAERLTITVDSLRLQQVLVNIVVNATKFCQHGSIVVRIDNRKDEHTAYVSVSDTGIGIPKEKQASVFGRFERVGESAEGFGLGLSICKFIVERLGGKIWVDPEYTSGARFVFTLPYGQSSKRREEA